MPQATHPTTLTSSVGRIPATLTALYVVTPAQVNGAASTGSTPGGTSTTNRASATAYSANPPSIEYPVFRCSAHSVSQPLTQYRHRPQA
jgi:hypothetical protein